MLTMKNIAKMAGVSQSTVSRVLSGNTSVDPDVKLKVMQLVRKHDYKPNVIAQNLVGGKSMLMGVIIPNISNPFFSDVVMSVESQALKSGYSIILCNSNGSLEKEKNYLAILKSYNVDGMLIVPCNNRDKYLQGLRNSEIPMVVITQDVQGLSCVSISHKNAGKEVARHLINMGYSKYVFVGKMGDDKEIGFREELENSGINTRRDYIIIDNEQINSVNINLKQYINNSSEQDGIGIFAVNDVEALIVLNFLKEMQLKIPEKVALVGFDNTFFSKEVSPAISSVAQPVEEIGKKAIDILIDKINKHEIKEDIHIILEPRLVVRESSVKITKY